MAIIYSYPTVVPTKTDLILGTDVSTTNKSTKNFTVQSIIDLVTIATGDLQTVLNLGNTAVGRDIVLGSIGVPSNTIHAGVFTTGPGLVVISNNTAIGFSNVSSISFTGNLTGRLLSTGQAAQIASAVQAVTQAPNDNSTKIATTAYVDTIIDPSILTFAGTTGGPQTVTLVNQTFSLLGTTSEIKTAGSAQTLTISLADGAFGSGSELILPDGASATTQLASDDSTKVATTEFVRNYDDTQDLDFTDGTSSSTVLLNSETLTFEGTALQVTTAVSAQKVKFTLPTDVTIGGIFTGVTFSGDLNGTVNTATTGVTQTANNNSTKIATTAYVDAAAGAKILQYQGDTGGPFDLNLKDDDLDIAGGSNISTTAATVATNLGVITIDLNDNVTISGTSKADTFTTTAGTATWVTTVLDGFTAITSDLFTGPLVGNADTATALASSGALSFGGEVTLSSSSPSPATYTSGGNITLNLGLNNAAVTGKILTGLVIPASGSSVVPSDTILSGIGKLQAQVNTGATGLRFMGSWNASMDTGGTDNTPNGTPALTSGGGLATSGTNTSVNTPVDNKLIDSSASFTSTVTASDRVYNEAGAFTTITSIDSDTELTLVDAIFLTTGQAYTIDNDPALSQGEYYVVSAVGATESRNATLNSIQNWQVGDWVIAGASNVWERLDQTSIEGAGTAGRIAKFSDTSVIADSIILEESGGIKLDSGKTLTTQGTGGNIVVAGAATISGLTTAGAALSLTGGVTLPVGTYGTVGQVLTNDASPGATTDLIWTTPTTGVVESITGGTGITVDDTSNPGTAAIPVVNIDYLGTDNAILSATDISTGSIATTDQIWFNDVNTGTVTNTVKYAPVSKLPFNDYSWIIEADAGTGSPYTVANGDTIDFVGVGNVSTAWDNTTKELRISASSDPGSGTQFTLPVWDTTTSLGDSMVKQDAATGTVLTVSGAAPALVIENTTALSGQLDINVGNDTQTFTSTGIQDTTAGGTSTFGDFLFRQKQVITDGTTTTRSILTLNSAGNVIPTANVIAGGYIDAGAGIRIKTDTDAVLESIVADKDILLKGTDDTTAITALKLDMSEAGYAIFNAGGSFAGNVDVTGSQITVDPASGDAILQLQSATQTLRIDQNSIRTSTDSALSFLTHSDTALTLDTSQNGTFEENLLVKGDLTVNGAIIHGGGGGGTAKGGTFTKLFTTGTVAGGANTAFTITRATTGSMVFDVMFTGETRASSSVTKKFTVVKQFGNSNDFISTFKILDTGPGIGNAGTDDFTVVFEKKDTDGLGLNCTIAPVAKDDQKIGITIILGFGENDATIVMN